MARLRLVSSVKFEIFIPVSFVDPADPTQAPQTVNLRDVVRYLARITAKYKRDGGYTISNPFAPPPYAGAYQGGPLERSFVVILILPDPLLQQAEEDVERMISYFQTKYKQIEILAYHYSITRYVP